MHFNMLLTSAMAGLIPLLVGFIWYNPKVFGTAWMNVNGFTDPEKMKEGFNFPLIAGLTFIFGFFIAFGLTPAVIHQFGFMGMLQQKLAINDAEGLKFFTDGFNAYGNEFRTFKHGTLHGTISGVCLALPVVAISALFERRGFKYIAINAGFWILCFCLIGGFVCQFADVTLETFK